MLLIPQISFTGELSLDAYSFSSYEINSVVYVLDKSGVDIVNENLSRDREGRIGLRFIIHTLEIVKLERTLRVKFSGEGENTKVSFTKGDQGKSYRCSRIDTPPNGCETISANDEQEAIVKCALVANNKNWLGGVPTPGQC
jgi:hypothetical protein